MKNNKIIEIKNLEKSFYRRSVLGGKKVIPVLRNINFDIKQEEVFNLVGESGCGKTTTGKIIAGLIHPTSGEVLYRGKNIWDMKKQEFKKYRKAVQMIHQDPYASLNPMKQVYDILSAPLFRHNIVKSRNEAREKVLELLETVGMTPPKDFIDKYPHELSGGQRQRIVIARALTINPEFIVADEAVSMLDVSIRLSVIELLSNLKEKFGVAFLFITHDLAMAKYFGWHGRIAVMYVGKIVELGPTPEVIDNPLHPYTKALLAAIPEPDPEINKKKKMMKLRSLDIPNLMDLPSGCKFHPRCPFWIEGKCDKVEPELVEIEKGHFVACHLFDK